MAAPQSELLDRLQDISVCQVMDALGPSCPLETSLPPVDPRFRICGPATTVLCAENDNLTLHHALHLAQPGEVLVVECGGSTGTAFWGELMSLSAKSRGLRGTITDGAVRDHIQIQQIGYPVFARTLNPRRTGKEKYGKLNAPINCGCLKVNPGDVMLADVNGIIVIPANGLEATVEAALDVERKEASIQEQISRGRTIFEILELENRVPREDQ